MATRGRPQNYLWAKNAKTLNQKFFKFSYNIPHDMEMCRLIFQGFTGIKNGHHRPTSIFFVAKTKKKLSEIINILQVIFLTIWCCARDFFKVLLKFKMAAMDELYNFLCAQKLKNRSQK